MFFSFFLFCLNNVFSTMTTAFRIVGMPSFLSWLYLVHDFVDYHHVTNSDTIYLHLYHPLPQLSLFQDAEVLITPHIFIHS